MRTQCRLTADIKNLARLQIFLESSHMIFAHLQRVLCWKDKKYDNKWHGRMWGSHMIHTCHVSLLGKTVNALENIFISPLKYFHGWWMYSRFSYCSTFTLFTILMWYLQIPLHELWYCQYLNYRFLHSTKSGNHNTPQTCSHDYTNTHTCARQTHSYTQTCTAKTQTCKRHGYTLSHSTIQTHTHPQCDADSLKGLISPAFLCLSALSDPAFLYV